MTTKLKYPEETNLLNLEAQGIIAFLYHSEKREQNQERYGDSDDQCICCMKPMKAGETKMVHMNTAWVAVNQDIVTEDNCEKLTGYKSQGFFKVGNSCARKMGKAFVK